MTPRVAQAGKVTSLGKGRQKVPSREGLLLLPPSVVASRGPGGPLLWRARPPAGGDRPPAPCQQTRSCSPRALGKVPALPLGSPCPAGSTRVRRPPLWNPPGRPRPPWGLRAGSHRGEGGAQGPGAGRGRNSAAAGRRGSRRRARRRSAGRPGPRGQQQGPARPGASGRGAAVGRRLQSASGSGGGNGGDQLKVPVCPGAQKTQPPREQVARPTSSSSGHPPPATLCAPRHGEPATLQMHTFSVPEPSPVTSQLGGGRGGVPCRVPSSA